MATTTNYGWTTPDDTDLVKDGAAAIRTLGSSADSTVKNLNPGTTAGDVDYYTSGTAKARLPIGTAGQVLTVNSGETAPEWATPASPSNTFVGCALTKNADQSLSHNVTTAITFTNETIDSDGFHDNSTNTSRITIPSGKNGTYLLTATLTFNASGAATGSRRLHFYKNGTSIANIIWAPRDGFTSASASFIASAVATDYFEVYAFQNTGGAQDVIGYATDGNVPTTFTASLIGA